MQVKLPGILSISTLLAALFSVLLATSASRAGLPASKERSPIAPTPLALSQIWHDENEVELLITNRGPIGQNLMVGSGAGSWPKDTGNNYVFGCGLWIGGIADVNTDGDPDTITVLGYDPSSGETECAEGRVGQSTSDPLARVFDSQDSTDLSEWPDEFRNQLGNPIVLSDQDLVTIYNDISQGPIGAFRLGVQVNQRSMAFSGNVAGTSIHAIYFLWQVVNASDSLPEGPYTIEDMYVGFTADMDVGMTATEDMTSFIPTFTDGGDTVLLNSAVVWDQNFVETGFQGEVGLVGFSFDEAMLPGSDVHFTFMSNPGLNQPRPDPDPGEDGQQYRILACLDGSCEEHDIATDVRFVLSMGPIDLAPGESQMYRGVLYFADPFADPSELVMSGEPIRIDPYQQAMANFLQVAMETKAGLQAGPSPSPFSIFRTSLQEDVADTLGPYVIYTGITDSIGVHDVTLHYSTDGGSSFDPVPMDVSGILNWSGDVPGQPVGTTVLYYVEASDSAGVMLTDPPGAPGSTFSFQILPPTGIGGGETPGTSLPAVLALNQNYPNPFNPSTTISFEIPGSSDPEGRPVALTVFDLRGRRIRSLIESDLVPGTYRVHWDGLNEQGQRIPSGIYLYTLRAGEETQTRKMTILK